jgi:hypothetical protein
MKPNPLFPRKSEIEPLEYLSLFLEDCVGFFYEEILYESAQKYHMNIEEKIVQIRLISSRA